MIAVVGNAPEDSAICRATLEGAGATPLAIEQDDHLPPHASALLLVGHGWFDPAESRPPVALAEALGADLPILGIEWGMQAINAAYGGKAPVESPAHESPESPSKHRVFLTMGGKVSSIVGGAGVVAIRGRHSHGITEARRGKGLMSSAFAVDDGLVEAVEVPGDHFVIGVQWPVHLPEVPSGFENLVPALVARASARPAA